MFLILVCSICTLGTIIMVYGGEHDAALLQTPLLRRDAGWDRPYGLLGSCAYLLGFALPFPWDVPLALLGVFGILTLLSPSPHRLTLRSPLVAWLLLFGVSTGLSMLASVDSSRSLIFSASFLPAILIFFLVADHHGDIRGARLLYLTLSAVALGLACWLLWAWWHWELGSIHEMVRTFGSPVLAVPNDVTFLAIIAPLSLALLYRQPRSGGGFLALLSLLASLSAVCALRSRTGILAMSLSLVCAAALMPPRRRLLHAAAYGVVFLLGALLIDGLLGFPLTDKVIRKATILGRMGYWSTAWTMFRDAPLLGQGPHTFGIFHRTPGCTICISKSSQSGASSASWPWGVCSLMGSPQRGAPNAQPPVTCGCLAQAPWRGWWACWAPALLN